MLIVLGIVFGIGALLIGAQNKVEKATGSKLLGVIALVALIIIISIISTVAEN
ncbi:MAG: hypothetical protein K6F64_05795 [Clostridia bacterium]|nr:hypothetical protein [Clostridia bacterium]